MKLSNFSKRYQRNDGPMKDYRVIGNNNPFKNVDSKKKELQKTLESEHPSTKNHHSLIRPKSSEYKKKFANIYGERCAYCGIDYSIKNCMCFEVDHFISPIHGGEDHINNLIYACQCCNRKKRSFKIPEKDYKILNPDQELGKTFYRDEMFHIKISNTYENNDTVKNFYSQMKFNHEERRIEYLMLAINKLLLTIKNENKKSYLRKIFIKLLYEYNRGSFVRNIKKLEKNSA